MRNNTDNQTDESSGLSPKQKAAIKKYAVFALMGLICAGSFYIIFSPSKDDKAKKEQLAGFNADIPMPKEGNLINDKRVAYEQEQIKQRQSERMQSLQDFSALINDRPANQGEEITLYRDAEPDVSTGKPASGSGSRQPSSIEQSATAYRDMNRTLGSFYERPREDPEKERLKQELEELKSRMEEPENRTNPMDNQLELMEKSFQMASRYMPGFSGQNATQAGFPGASGISNEAQNNTIEEQQESNSPSGNAQLANTPVTQVRDRTVSALLPEMSDAEFIEAYSQPRNTGFLTAAGETNVVTKNTVSACIHADQTVMDGQNVRLRLLEPIHAGSLIIPRNTTISGTAKIQGERLGITVSSLETSGIILQISLRVFDLDGQSGIFIPNMQEINAAKEIVANLGTNAGTSINLSNDAEKQFIADMGRNVIQGVSQFTAKKLREVKVHLKAGYKIYLISEESLKAGKTQLANK